MDKKKNPLDMYQQVWDETKAQKQPWRTALNNYQQAYTQMKQQGIMPSTNAPSQVNVETPQETRSIAPNAKVKTVQKLNEAPTTETVAEEKVETPTSDTITETKVERPSANFNSYASLNAPDTLKNDQMSGYRPWMNDINNYYKTKYGAGIMDIDPSDIDNAEDRKKYFEDYGLFNTIYSAVANYDAEALAEQKKAQEAEEYANTRRLLMERYLPEMIRSMGYANTGLAADALTGINASYDNYALNARETAAANTNAAMSRYQQAIADYQAGQVANKQAEDTAITQAQEAEYKNFKAGILDDPTFDTKQLDTALALGNITEDQYNALMHEYDTKRTEEKEGANKMPSMDGIGYQGVHNLRDQGKFQITEEQITHEDDDIVGDSAKIPEGGWGSIVQGLPTGLSADMLEQYAGDILKKEGLTDASYIADAIAATKRPNGVTNGKIFDLNVGKGELYVIYIDGYFYPLEID